MLLRPDVPVRFRLQVSCELRLPRDRQALTPTIVIAMDETRSRDVEDLLVTHRDELLAFLRRRGPARAVAEDIVQQVAVRALHAGERLRDPTSGRAWLFKITRHLLAEHFRNARARTSGVTEPENDALQQEFGCSCVVANLQRLPTDHAQLLQRVVVDGASIAAVARELGVTQNAATVRLHRARTALRQRLLAHCGTQSLRECLDCSCNERRCCEAELEKTSPRS